MRILKLLIFFPSHHLLTATFRCSCTWLLMGTLERSFYFRPSLKIRTVLCYWNNLAVSCVFYFESRLLERMTKKLNYQSSCNTKQDKGKLFFSFCFCPKTSATKGKRLQLSLQKFHILFLRASRWKTKFTNICSNKFWITVAWKSSQWDRGVISLTINTVFKFVPSVLAVLCTKNIDVPRWLGY